jgi:polyhydroxyalkanoate synthesis regulator phasin
MQELDTKVEVTSVKMDSIKTDVTELRKQLTRIEDKLDNKQGSK